MIEPTFFEIPIYRCDLEEHTKYMETEEAKILQYHNKDLTPTAYWNAYSFFHNHKWHSWNYNEVIGYICLYIFGSHLRGDLWIIDAKRINKGIIRKKFKLCGKAIDKALPKNVSSDEVFEFIISTLVNYNKKVYKKHLCDLSTFKTIGRFVDWNKLAEELNSFVHSENK